MDVILVPGFWLDGSSWEPVTRALEEAGHTPHPLTLAGKHGRHEERSQILLGDHITEVVAAVDGLEGPVVLVGHSGGGAIVGGAVDARPDRVAHAVYVDAGPLAAGAAINDALPVVGSEIPLPDWSVFDDADLRDLDDGLRERFRSMAVPEPVGVAVTPMVLRDERRHEVPVTVIACEFPSTVLRDMMRAGHPYTSELAVTEEVEFVDLPTGHWPQLTRPDDLAREIVRIVDETAERVEWP